VGREWDPPLLAAAQALRPGGAAVRPRSRPGRRSRRASDWRSWGVGGGRRCSALRRRGSEGRPPAAWRMRATPSWQPLPAPRSPTPASFTSTPSPRLPRAESPPSPARPPRCGGQTRRPSRSRWPPRRPAAPKVERRARDIPYAWQMRRGMVCVLAATPEALASALGALGLAEA